VLVRAYAAVMMTTPNSSTALNGADARPDPLPNAILASMPIIDASSVPVVSSADMAEVDRLAVDVYGINLLQMMEQAGSHLATVVAAELDGDLAGKRILVAVGPGNNGGGGLAAARHLVNRGAQVQVVLARPARRLSEGGRHQLATLLEMGVSCCMAMYDISDAEIDDELAEADLVIDAVLGYRGRGAPHDEVATLIDRIEGARTRMLSLDVPSGMDADTGEAADGAIFSRATMTLALPKRGLVSDAGRKRVGRLYLADIGLPGALYSRMDIDAGTPFSAGRIVRLSSTA
jgi:NAD(P)H-hydrate epimerase